MRPNQNKSHLVYALSKLLVVATNFDLYIELFLIMIGQGDHFGDGFQQSIENHSVISTVIISFVTVIITIIIPLYTVPQLQEMASLQTQ